MEDLPTSLRLLTLVLLLGVNSFFAAAEVALVSVRETRMRQLAEAGDRRARAALSLLAAPDRMLSATQLGVTLASLGLGWAGESTVYRMLEPLTLSTLPPGSEEVGHMVAFALAFMTITYLHMVLGEVVPKNIALERSERLALAVAPPLQLFAGTTGLFVSAVKVTAARISRLLGLRMAFAQDGYSAQELKLILSVSKREGEHAKRQEGMLHRVIDFYELTVREVMTPRQEIVALPLDATIDQTLECLARRRHSRLPVYEDSPENIVGAIHAKEIWSFMQQLRRRQSLGRPTPKFLLQAFLRPIEFVPETKMLHELLDELQQRHVQMVVVVDEFGTVSGLLTVEDAIEQIVGEIREEHETPLPAAVPGETVEVEGNANIRDLELQQDIELPYDAGFETLAGFILSRIGHIPAGGESIEHEGRRFTVVEMDRNRIARVKIEPLEEALQDDSA